MSGGGLLASTCTFEGFRYPVPFKFTYFSYLNGDDIRSNCANDGPEILRFLYDGDYTEQVRTYDLVSDRRDSGRFILDFRVSSEADFSFFTTDFFTNWIYSRPGDSLNHG